MNKKLKTKPKRISLIENELLEYIRNNKEIIIEELKLGYYKSNKEKYAFMFLKFLNDIDLEDFDDDFIDERIKSEKTERYVIVKKVKKSEMLLINFFRSYKDELINDLETVSINICEPVGRHGRILRSISGMLHRSKYSLDGLFSVGVFTEEQKEIMLKYISEHRNILITGCSGVGKTTLLKALLEYQNSTSLKFVEFCPELFFPSNELKNRNTLVESIGELNVRDFIDLSLNTTQSTLIISEILWGKDNLQELEFTLKNMSNNTNILSTCQQIFTDYMSDNLKKYLNDRNIVEIHFQDINSLNRSRKIEYIKDLSKL